MSPPKIINCDCGKHMNMTGGNHLTNCPLNRESYVNPDKPEWKEGELPIDGTKCEAIWEESPDGGELGWQKVTYKRG